MGQKINPIGFRIGITKKHSSFWYSKPKNYSFYVKEDIFIRDYITNMFKITPISKIEIKRQLTSLEVNLHVAKSNFVLRTKKSELFTLRNNLSSLIATNFASRKLTLNLVDIKNPDLDARFLADFARNQLEKRVPFRRVIRSTIIKAQKANAKGIKAQISGRLNGTEIARTEWTREGQVPLHTLKANIDYCSCKAQTIYGILGIKIWVYIL
uniref:ribosomal protein S3 n=1 Tax=Colacium mucronatum TaxID=167756 RepID=UPI0023AA716E|nr:ribosomal protein S3 [Colacium mucronatum]WCH63247.1 ribosomal protein S3 [Colacium mucronatum]